MWVVTSCGLVRNSNILEQLGGSIFRFQRPCWSRKLRKRVPSDSCFTCKTAWLHTPENCSLNCEVRYTVTKELIFTANVVCSIPPVTEGSKWRQHIVLFKIVTSVEPNMLLLFLVLCSVLRTALVLY